MRTLRDVRLQPWAYAALLVVLSMGCPSSSGTNDAAQDIPSPPDVTDDRAPSETAVDVVEVATPSDIVDDLRDASSGLDVADATDLQPTGCTPGVSVACACTDGRMGAQVCGADRTYGPCQCTGPMDGGTGDVVLPPLPARLLAPQSVSRVTSRRPTLRWVLPAGVTRARVELCADRPCTRMLVQQEVTGTSWRPTALLAPGVTYWRVRGLGADGGVAWASATWEFVVGQRDAPVDTSFGTIKDFNGDGFDDVAASEQATIPDTLRVFNGRAEGGSVTSSLDVNMDRSASALGVGDFNGDGFADLVLSNIGQGTLQMRYGGRTGLPAESSFVLRYGNAMTFGQNLAVGDVDGDGFSDLVTISRIDADAGRPGYRVELFRGSERGLNPTPSGLIDPPSNYIEWGLGSVSK